ncbi:hypothetical protein F0562_030524 [Nyssa sinensis]|uniref:Serine-threonine/tyrosine-protein kinase catalytic domain-containing protein n=1 Tax=Nyssa sinensis TaxID=561372 RepID=A0A5J5B2Z5_9ASTE|nr:hypothetical protein F0562_030524 [Nyssa sinensis]
MAEYGTEGRVSTKGDIYSYGIMLLETFTRKKPTDEMFAGELTLRQWVNASLPNKIMEVLDSGLLRTEDSGDMTATQGYLLAIMELGLECSEEFPDERIDIKDVVVLNSSEKSKPKTAARTSEMNVAAKSIQQQPHSLQLANQSLRGGQVRPDGPRTSYTGKFCVLKPVWENGVSSMAKDVSSPTSNATRVANSQQAVSPSAPSAPVRTPNTSKLSTVERKAAALALNPIGTVEKRPSLSQAQSRSATVLSSTVDKSGGAIKEVSAPTSPCETGNGSKVTSNGDTHEEFQRLDVGEKNSCLNGTGYPDEEKAAFLRSLGWEENAGEDEGLTEEEINGFYQEVISFAVF